MSALGATASAGGRLDVQEQSPQLTTSNSPPPPHFPPNPSGFPSNPNPMQVVYFVNSGSEANDMAIMLARLHTGQYDLIGLRNAYHGLSETVMGVMGLNTWKANLPQVSRPAVWERGKECWPGGDWRVAAFEAWHAPGGRHSHRRSTLPSRRFDPAPSEHGIEARVVRPRHGRCA